MATQASIKAVLEGEAQQDDGVTTLPIELDEIPGAVWQAELQSLLPPELRVSLFERSGRKCALLRFATVDLQAASAAFASALAGANEVSEQAHRAARAALEARERAKRAKESAAEPNG